MTDIGQQLRDADPLIHEPGLSPEDARKIRQEVVAAARESGFRSGTWQPALIAAVAMLALAAVVGVKRWRSAEFTTSTVPEADVIPATEPGRSPAARRQLQFATPGGTRVIWVFDSKFEP
jgi:hypothetical protein